MRLNIISGLLLLSGLFQFSLGQQELDCSEFKTGKYHYTPPNGGEVSLKRTKKKQIERYNDENQKFIFSIHWINDCTYELILSNARGLPRERKKEILGTKLVCEVIESNLGHYVVLISSEDQPKEEVTIYSNR